MRDGHALHGSAGSLNEVTIEGVMGGGIDGRKWGVGAGDWGLTGGENELDLGTCATVSQWRVRSQ